MQNASFFFNGEFLVIWNYLSFSISLYFWFLFLFSELNCQKICFTLKLEALIFTSICGTFRTFSYYFVSREPVFCNFKVFLLDIGFLFAHFQSSTRTRPFKEEYILFSEVMSNSSIKKTPGFRD